MPLIHETSTPILNGSIHELAALLAAGIIRLKSGTPAPEELSANVSESARQGLEFQAQTRLSVSHGFTVARPPAESTT